MCRLSAFFGDPICAANLVTRPSRSIITQSFDARERIAGDASTPGYLNGDGFGLGWYSVDENDRIPCVYRQARPAWNDPNLSSIAEKVHTQVLFAHVRAASPGLDVSEATCHPFRYGRYLWMHNGGLGSFSKLRRRLLPTLRSCPFDFAVTHGSSDTALCFAVFLNQIHLHVANPTPDALRQALETTIVIIEQAVRDENITDPSLLNFVVSDGETLVASRYVINLTDENAKAASLYYASGNSYQSDGTAPGNFSMMHTDRRPTLAIVSSEPLTESRSDWVPVPRNFCIVVTKSMHILLSSIRAAPHHSPDDRLARILANLTTVKIPSSPISARRAERFARQRDSPAAPGTITTRNSAYDAVSCPVGAAVRSSVSIPDRIVLCCMVVGHFLCSGTNNGFVHIWDMEQNCLHVDLDTGSSAVLSLLGNFESRVLLVGTSASVIHLYKFSEDGAIHPALTVCCEGMGDVLSLAMHNNRVFAGFSDAGLRRVIDDVSLYQLPSSTPPNDDSCRELDLSSVKPTPNLNVSDVSGDRPLGGGIVEHCGFVFALAHCLNGRFLCSGCGDGILRVWDVERSECVQTRNDHSGAILTLAVYEVPHGTMLFSGSRDCSIKVWVWDGDQGFICKRTLRKHQDEIAFLHVAGDKLVSGSADGLICVWCADSMRLICQYRDLNLKAGSVSLTYNSLFTASDEGMIQVRDIISMERDILRRDSERSMDILESISRSASFSGDAENVYSYQKGSLKAGTKLMELPLSELAGNGKRDEGQKKSAANGTENGAANGASKEIVHDSGAIVSEVADDSDDTETLVPGVMNEELLAPPMSTVKNLNGVGSSDEETESGSVTDVKVDDRTFINRNKSPMCAHGVKANGVKNETNGGEGIAAHVTERRLMHEVLREFISYPTVAQSSEHRESCWQGARYIGRFLESMGASVKYVNTSLRGGSGEVREDIPSKLSKKEARSLALQSESNPIVLARFASTKQNAPTITFYGHYDVMPAFDLTEWSTDPWELKTKDGYMYGRGTTDNKGPIVAMVFAVKRLMEESVNGLGVNVVLVLQGEAEASNAGFKESIASHMHWFEGTCLILTSNSMWLGENRPCLTYGFRGIMDVLVTVRGAGRNLHSGVDGGAVFEPMHDLLGVCGTLVDVKGEVQVEGFYDDVRGLNADEREQLAGVEFEVEEYRKCTGVDRFTAGSGVELLERRWRKPSISVTSVETSNVSGFFSVMPRRASAKVSIRFVPDQDPEQIEEAVRGHLEREMRERGSPNRLEVRRVNCGDWWLGDARGEEFEIAAKAVREVWGVEPALVCEGGSMPLFSFLGKRLGAPVVQVPLGQASDGAHLPNERIRELNLYRGKDVLRRIVSDFAARRLQRQQRQQRQRQQL